MFLVDIFQLFHWGDSRWLSLGSRLEVAVVIATDWRPVLIGYRLYSLQLSSQLCWSQCSVAFIYKNSCWGRTCLQHLLLLRKLGALEINIWIFASNFSRQALCVKPFSACYTKDLQLISHVSTAGGSIAYRPLTFIMYNKMLQSLCQFFFKKMYLNRAANPRTIYSISRL